MRTRRENAMLEFGLRRGRRLVDDACTECPRREKIELNPGGHWSGLWKQRAFRCCRREARGWRGRLVHLHHAAVMLSVATATSWKTGLRVGREDGSDGKSAEQAEQPNCKGASREIKARGQCRYFSFVNINTNRSFKGLIPSCKPQIVQRLGNVLRRGGSRANTTGESRELLPKTQAQVDNLRDLHNYIRRMRKSPILDALFPAVRQHILAALFVQPERWWYLSELASHLDTSPSSLQRELASLTEGGILERKQDGRRTYFKAQRSSPVFAEIHLLFIKTAGIVPALQTEIRRFQKEVTWAMIYGSVARCEEHGESDVDLMIVGRIGTADLLPTLRRLERKFSREINIIRYSDEEFNEKARRRDHFLLSVLKGQLILLKGSKDELERATRAA